MWTVRIGLSRKKVKVGLVTVLFLLKKGCNFQKIQYNNGRICNWFQTPVEEKIFHS